MPDWIQILIGGLVTTAVGGTLTYYYNHLASERQYRQALEQKMIDRLSGLVENYYGQIVFCSGALGRSLAGVFGPGASPRDRHIAFYNLVAYLYHVDRLHQNRPIPLLTTIQSEKDYLKQTTEVYESLPFGAYQVSLLIQFGREDGGLASPHRLINQISQNSELQALYVTFDQWLNSCRCQPGTAARSQCRVHEVIDASVAIAIILEDEVKEAYRLWYGKSRRKSEGGRDIAA
jgi:hypothetical protein